MLITVNKDHITRNPLTGLYDTVIEVADRILIVGSYDSFYKASKAYTQAIVDHNKRAKELENMGKWMKDNEKMT